MRAHAIKMLKKPVRLFKRQTEEFHYRSVSKYVIGIINVMPYFLEYIT